MNIDEFFSRLDGYFQKNELDKVAPFLTDSLEKAKEAEDYASYITIGNEMIGFYRSVSMFREAFDIAEDVLLLMEELQLGERTFCHHPGKYGHCLPGGRKAPAGFAVLQTGIANLRPAFAGRGLPFCRAL